MGILDTAKTLSKTQQARSKMADTKSVGIGKSGGISMMLNGLYELVETEARSNLFNAAGIEGLNDEAKSNFMQELEESIKEAYQNAKKELEAQLTSGFDMDSFKDLLGGDIQKMMAKAQEAKSKMGKMGAAGVSKNGNLGIYLNGLNEMPEAEIKIEFIQDHLSDIDSQAQQNIKQLVEEEVVSAYADAKNSLEREIANNFDANSLSGLLE